MALNWGKEPKPSQADLPRKLRGSERPGHAHEGLIVTATLALVAALGVLGFASWNIDVTDVGATDAQALGNAGTVLFATAGATLVALGLWLFLDLRTPLLLVGGGSTVAMVLGGFVSPIFWLVAPAAFAGFWGGLSALEKHPRDRWLAVALAALLGLALGRVGLLVLAPVALAAALVPELEFGERKEPSGDD